MLLENALQMSEEISVRWPILIKPGLKVFIRIFNWSTPINLEFWRKMKSREWSVYNCLHLNVQVCTLT